MTTNASSAPTVRPATPADADAVIAFYDDLIDQIGSLPTAPNWEKGVYPTHDYLRECIAAGEFFVAQLPDAPAPADEKGTPRLAGACLLRLGQDEEYDRIPWKVAARPDQILVVHLIASATWAAGHGVGRALLDYACDEARRNGCTVVRLDTLTTNTPAQHLYERYGFDRLGNFDLTYPTTGTMPLVIYELGV